MFVEYWAIKEILEEIASFSLPEGYCLPVIYISQAEEESNKTALRSVTGPQSKRSELSHVAERGLSTLVPSWINSKFLKTRIYAICLTQMSYHKEHNMGRAAVTDKSTRI